MSEVVLADVPNSFTLRMDGMDQSHVDLADPTRIAFDYVRRLADVVDASAPEGDPVRIVHVGGGALTLPRYVLATRPRSSQIVFEPDVEQTELVRRELPWPKRSGIRVRPVEGRPGVEALRDDATEMLIVDAFAAGRVPASLVSTAFYTDVARALTGSGLLAINLVDRAPFAFARRAIAAVRTAFDDLLLTAEPATLRGRRQGNLVVVAGATVPLARMRDAVAGEASPHRVLDNRAVSDSFGGGRPFTDADAVAGPMPE